MSSAQGHIKSPKPGRFIATFEIDGSLFIFDGNLNPPPPPFESDSATIQYNTLESLIQGAGDFTGVVGSRGEVSFTFSDGTSIKGPLDYQVGPMSHVEGTGHWTQA